MSLTLYATPTNIRAQKVLIASEFAALPIQLAPNFQFGVDNKSEEYKRTLRPDGKVPALQTPHGPVWESNAILRHVARLRPEAQLYGKNAYHNALVDQWVDYAATEIEPLANLWLGPINGYIQFNPKAYQEAKNGILSALSILDAYLLHHTYFVGHNITIADIALFASLYNLFRRVLSPELRQPYTNVVRWFLTVANQPQVVKVVGQVQLATEEQKAAGAAAGGKKEKAAAAAAGGAAAAGKQAGSKKKESPKAAKKPAAEEKDEAAAIEDQIAAEQKKKPKSKLDLLPPTKMDLDTVKRLAFAVRPFNPNFFEELLKDHWDPDGWSWWTASYKYNDENKVLYMTGNLIGGFTQRCDAVRKYAMGVMNIIGNEDEETPPFPVAGAFLFRGREIPDEMMVENPDSEYYEWKQVDITNPQQLEQLKQYFLADTLNGQKVLDRRYMK